MDRVAVEGLGGYRAAIVFDPVRIKRPVFAVAIDGGCRAMIVLVGSVGAVVGYWKTI